MEAGSVGPLENINQEHEQELRDSLKTCRDAKETADVLHAYWDALRAAYLQGLRTQREREIAAPLFAAVIEGVSATGAMTRAQVQRTALPTVTLPGRASYREIIRRYAAPALCVISSAACILSGNTIAALFTLISAAVTGFTALRAAEGKRMQEEVVSAAPVPDVEELVARTRTSVGALDILLTRSLRLGAGERTLLESLTWTRQELESVQMLWEAYEDGDGDYALKAVPLLLSELSGQQVTLRRYGEGVDESFDLLPGLECGRTIRPALYAGDKLLMRGQATCEAEKVEVTGL